MIGGTTNHKNQFQQDFIARSSIMDLNGVNLFVCVVEAGSLTGAAKRLGITTSGVSRALVRLEEDLGIRLLQRTTRKLSLTSAGRTYFEHVKGALAQVAEASVSATEMGEQPRGSVRLTAPPALAGLLIGLIAEFQERYPNVLVELTCSQGIVDLVENGLDLALRLGRLRDSSLMARSVGHLVTGLFASRDYIRRRGQPQKPADLARHNCVLFRGQGGRDNWRLRAANRVCSVQVTGSLDVDDIPAAHQAILAGIGIGSISVFSSQRLQGLVRVLPRYIYADLPINLVWPSKRLEPARVVLLREFLATKLSAQRWRG